MKKTFFLKLYPAMIACIILPLAILGIVMTFTLKNFGIALSEYELSETTRITATVLKNVTMAGPPETTEARIDATLKDLSNATRLRFTIIRADGRVLFDSLADPVTMENHGNRPEVVSALATGSGHAFRSSATINEDSAYAAWRLDLPAESPPAIRATGPWIIRTSLPMPLIGAMMATTTVQIGLACLAILVAAALAAWFMARRLRLPVARLEATALRWASGNLGARAMVKEPFELARLSETMNTMASDLQERMQWLEQSREESLAILNSMAEAVIVTGAGGRVVALNPMAARLFSQANGDFGTDTHRSLLELSHATELASLEERARHGELAEATIEWFGAERLNLKVTAAPLAKQGGAVIVLNDITRLMKLETIRKDFVANVSHELKTPIQSIKGFIETLESGGLNDPEDAKRFLGIIRRNSDRLEAIIDDLLSLARLEGMADKGGIAKQAVDLNKLARAVQDTLAEPIERRKIDITVETEGDGMVAGVEGLLEQLLLNLVDNAVKYTNPGSSVLISLGPDDTGRNFQIEVADNGPGIPARDLERIFERFYRVEKSRHRETGGTGLGLAIVRHIALLHGGTVAVQSQPGLGSTFTVSLPRE